MPGSSLPIRLLNLTHPVYTVLHLSFLVLGSAVLGVRSYPLLGWMLAAFVLGMGVSAHALDLLRGDPLKLGFSRATLWAVAGVSLALAAAIGIGWAAGSSWHNLWLVGFGVFFAIAYNLEWFGGAIHTDSGFALTWGVFPFIVGWVSQGHPTGWAGWPAAITYFSGVAFCYALSRAQRVLSTRARHVRRKIGYSTADLSCVEHALGWLCAVGALVAVMAVTLDFI